MNTLNCRDYRVFKENRQKAVDEYLDKYAFFAFSNEQLQKGLERFKEEFDAGDKLVQFAGSGFILKSKHQGLTDLIDNFDAVLRAQMVDPKFAGGAFLYEIGNHEYMINWQADYDVCSCFGSVRYGESKDYHAYLNELGYADPKIHDVYREAVIQHRREAEENGWY